MVEPVAEKILDNLSSSFSPVANRDTPISEEYRINLASSISALYLPGKLEGKAVTFLIDTGSTLNLLSKRIFDSLPLRFTHALQSFQIQSGTLADGSGLLFYGQIDLTGRLRSEFVTLSFVVADVEPDAILGMPFLRDNYCQVDCAESVLKLHDKMLKCTNRQGVNFNSKVQVVNRVTIPPSSEQLIACRLSSPICKPFFMVENHDIDKLNGLIIASSVYSCEQNSLSVRVLNPVDQPITVNAGSLIGNCIGIEQDQLSNIAQVDSVEENDPSLYDFSGDVTPIPEHLDSLYKEAAGTCTQLAQRQGIANLLNKYGDVFSRGDDDQGKTDLVAHSIEILADTRPVKQAPRRQGPEREAEIERQIQKLQQQGVIEPCYEAWSSPVVLVKKKDGSWRFCVDYRRLNLVTVQDAHPLPRIDESLDALAGSQYFSTLDMMSGYWQVPLDEDAKDKSAFCTRSGLWRWKVLPFGLTAAPATFQRLMERVLHGLHWKTLLLYLDDVIVIGDNFNNHLSHLEEVLARFKLAGLKLKPAKCHLFQTKVTYLGHVVSQDGVATDPEKVSAVADWPVPNNLKELQAFVGTAGYYRQYVESFASKARPLTKLNNPSTKFYWDEQCQNAFETIKQSLLTAPILGYPDPNLAYILDTDASLEGIGAVLSQVQDDQERVISYYSRALGSAERNYCVTRRELLAVVKAVNHFRPYLYGKEFKIRTDHASLLWLCRRTTPTAQVARWLEILSEFQFTIEHRPGNKHGNADGLSRRPCLDCKQCDRIVKSCGGPKIDEVEQDLQDQGKPGIPVETKVNSGQLMSPDNHLDAMGNFGASGNRSNNCRIADGAKGQDDVYICGVEDSDRESDPGVCDSEGSLTSADSDSTSSESYGSGSEGMDGNLRHPDQSGSASINRNEALSTELSQAQQLSGDVSIVYQSIRDQQQISPAVINLGSAELKKLSRLCSLMRIRDDGVLVMRVLYSTRPSEVAICPKEMKKDVVWETHRLSHAGIMKTLKRLRLMWYWPGMTSDIRRLVKSCEICQTAKTGGLRRAREQGTPGLVGLGRRSLLT